MTESKKPSKYPTYPKTRQKRLEKRRKEFYSYMVKGGELCDAVERYSKAYKVTEQALYRDWQTHDTWGDFIDQALEDRFLVPDAIKHLDEVLTNLWSIVEDLGTSARDKVRALSKISDIVFKKLEVHQSLGRIHKEPVKLEIDQEVEKLYEAVQNVAGEDQELQEKVATVLYEYGRLSEHN